MRSLALLVGAALVAACAGSPKSTSAPSGGGAGSSSGTGTSTSAGSDEASSSGGEASEAKADEAAKPAPAEPMDGAIPETKDAKPFARRHECPKSGCNLKLVVPEPLKPAASDAAPVVMWEEVLPPKTMLMFPRHAGLDVYGVLIDGEVSVMADDIKGKQLRVWKGGAFRAPGVGVNVFSKEPTRIVFAAVVNGKEGTVAKAIEQIEKKEKVAWSKRAGSVAGVELSQPQDLAWGGGAYHARIGFEGDVPASLGFLMMSKNAGVPEHVHDKQWELLAIVDGAGQLAKQGGPVDVSGASFVAIPPGTKHAWKPSGKSPTIAVQMYWPPGPEQRFKKLAEGGK